MTNPLIEGNLVSEPRSVTPEQFASLCWSMQASADQLSAIAMKAAVACGVERAQDQQCVYVTMMLGPLAAIEKLRRQLIGP